MAIKQEESSINKKFEHINIDSDKERRSPEVASSTSSEDSPSPNGMPKTTDRPLSLTENTTIKQTTTTTHTPSSMVSPNTNTTTNNKTVKFAMNYMGIADTAATGNYVTTD